MLGTVLSILLSGFVVGALARWAVPGPDPMPAWLTVAIGLAGSLIGWGIIALINGPDTNWVGLASFPAAVVLVVLYRRFVQRRPVWGPEAARFPDRGVGVARIRQRLVRAGIDPDRIGVQRFGAARLQPRRAQAVAPPRETPGDPTDSPAHYLGLLEELHDAGVLDDDEFASARTRLLERLRG